MKLGVAAAAGATCWMTRCLLPYMGDWSSRDGLREVGDAAGISTLPGGRRGHCRVGKAFTVGSATYEGSSASADWLLTAVTDEGRRI